MSFLKLPYKEIWAVDFEFIVNDGGLPRPICCVAKELRSSKTLRIWEDDLLKLKKPPFNCDKDSLFIAYYASAEFGCHLSLDWELPENVIDLFCEFRNLTNGLWVKDGHSLLGALIWHGLDAMSTANKDCMRSLILSGGPWSEEEKTSILSYCEEDVVSLERLLLRMEKHLDVKRAALRGRYMKAAARIENSGVPIDSSSFESLKRSWPLIKSRLIKEVDKAYGVYEGDSFRMRKFEEYLIRNNMRWPRLPSGRLALDDETFSTMSKVYGELSALRELRSSLSKIKLNSITVGEDGRNRTLLSAFRSKTGRNQPSNSKFIFGTSSWLRRLIKPSEGQAIAYIDWSQQEFGIAASLSEDANMIRAYESGDPYLMFAKLAGASPENATKASHRDVRELYKRCILATQYGMGSKSLANDLGQPDIVAKDLLDKHRKTFSQFWKWSDAAVDVAILHGKINTVFGWQIQTTSESNARSIRNFPMQANGSEILRLACCLATEDGLQICAPVHDAILLEAPANEIDDHVARAKKWMKKASEVVLNGFPLRAEDQTFIYPNSYCPEGGSDMWDKVWRLIADHERTGDEQLIYTRNI